MRVFLDLQIAQKLSVFVVGRQINQRPNEFVGERLLAVRTIQMLNPHTSNLHIEQVTSSLR